MIGRSWDEGGVSLTDAGGCEAADVLLGAGDQRPPRPYGGGRVQQPYSDGTWTATYRRERRRT